MNDFDSALRHAVGSLPAQAPPTTGRRLAERAAADGLLDVAYASVDSPLGPLVVATTPRGLVRVAYTEPGSQDDVLEDLAARVSPRMLEAPARLDEPRRELDEYFAGGRTDFDLPIDWSILRGFTLKVLRETARIDFGELRSYADVASAAGSPRAVRAAGNALGANPLPVVVPCHRVVESGGGIGGFGGGLETKRKLLALEGVLPEPLF
jgi:methylated-DNA-[protein]-cysteine S-methyltransferase